MRPKASVLILLILFGGLTSTLRAQQTGAVSGTLTNSFSGDVVPNALIVLEGPGGSRQVRTGPDGKFSFTDVVGGSYHLIARANGYLPLRSELTVNAGSQTSDIRINPELHFSEVTSVSPEGKSSFETFQATDVLGGQELTREMQPTLGATLENQPGIALRSFGPGPARPVVRGLDGDRVLIVEDGLRMGDLSSQSGDHGVNVNPASASSVEVVRGPATLLYGANAIGGLVNVVTNDIPKAPVTRATGGFTFDAGSNAGQAGGAGDVTVGNGNVALHLSGSGRRAGDFKTPDGDVPNSFNRAGFFEGGLSYTAENGYFGGSFAYDKTHYGIPLVEEGETNLNPRRQIFTLRGEKRNMGGAFDSFRGSFGYRRYRHDELDGEVVATAFKNDTTELELWPLTNPRRDERIDRRDRALTQPEASGEETPRRRSTGLRRHPTKRSATPRAVRSGRASIIRNTRRMRIQRNRPSDRSPNSPDQSVCSCCRPTRRRSRSASRGHRATRRSRSSTTTGRTAGTSPSRSAIRGLIRSTRPDSTPPCDGAAQRLPAR